MDQGTAVTLCMMWWQTLVHWVQAAILFVTAIIVGWYTKETYLLRKEAQRQTALQLRPFIILETTLEGKRKGFRLSNLGNGTALNVRVEDIRVEMKGETKTLASKVIRFPDLVPSLTSREKIGIRFKEGDKLPSETTEDPRSFLTPLLPALSSLAEQVSASPPDLPTITIQFEDIDKGYYFVKEKLVHGKVEIIDSGKC